MKSLFAFDFIDCSRREVSLWEKYQTLWTILIAFCAISLLFLFLYFLMRAEDGKNLNVLLQYCYEGKTETLSVKKGGTVPAPFPERVGFRFCGWYTDSTLSHPFDGGMAKHDMILYAKWDREAE